MNLPQDCENIIRGFVVDLQKREDFKNKIKNVSNELKEKFPPFDEEDLYFWKTYWCWSHSNYQLQSTFCTKCGNYTNSTYEGISGNAVCLDH